VVSLKNCGKQGAALSLMLRQYERWGAALHPWSSFEQLIDKCERLGKAHKLVVCTVQCIAHPIHLAMMMMLLLLLLLLKVALHQVRCGLVVTGELDDYASLSSARAERRQKDAQLEKEVNFDIEYDQEADESDPDDPDVCLARRAARCGACRC
jgi:hypothetical protein